MEKKVGKYLKNGALIGGVIGATYGLYAFGKNDIGRIFGVTFLGAVLVAWGSGAYANKQNVKSIESENQ